MVLTKWAVGCIFLLTVRHSHQALTYVTAVTTKKDVMLERMTSIFSRCQEDEMNYIGVVRDAEIPERWSLRFMRNLPTIWLKVPASILDRPLYSQNTYRSAASRYDRLHTFILFVSSPTSFKRTIEKLMESIWWNPQAFYSIVDITGSTCHRPEDYLAVAWRMDIESSVFFCIEHDGAQAVYTFNRYGNPTPRLWHEVDFLLAKETRTWGMWRHILQNRTTCEDLNFNKMVTVGGYRIKFVGVVVPPYLEFQPRKEGIERYEGLNGLILNTLVDKMNATMSVVLMGRDTRIHSLLWNVSSGQYDMLMNAQYIFDKMDYSTTYPHMDSGISTLSRPSGFDSNETKIVKFMSPWLIICTLLVSVFTIFVLGLLVGMGLSSAFLEVTRIMVNVSLLYSPKRTPLRIYMITVILLFVLTGSLFQSSLSTLLTASSAKPNIDNNEQLKETEYPIYMFAGYMNAIQDLTLRSRVKGIDKRDCSGYVINYPDTVCAADYFRLMRIAFENDLHMSKHRITNLYLGYVTRPNFPLVARIGRMMMSMSQGGLIYYWQAKTVAVYENKWAMKALEMKTKKYRTMKMSDLTFAFYVLLLGLAVSVVTFLTELSVARWKRTCGQSERRMAQMNTAFNTLIQPVRW